MAPAAAGVVQQEHQDVVRVFEGSLLGEEDNKSWVDDGSLDGENKVDDCVEVKDVGMVVELLLSNNDDIPLENVITDMTLMKPPVSVAFKKVPQTMDVNLPCVHGKNSTETSVNMKKVQQIIDVDSLDGPPKQIVNLLSMTAASEVA